jgi:hypothetical protein
MKNYEQIFEKLWNIYTVQNPHAKKVYDLFVSRGEEVINDHIAFRTFDDLRINIEVLSRVFIKNGFEYKGSYEFKEKKLFARHLEHKSDKNAPRVFISELKVGEFSEFLQNTIKSIIDKIPESKLNSDDLIYSGRLWGDISYQTYHKLREESEYAAWVYVNGFVANHFTVSVNRLKTFNGIREVNEFLKQNGFLLNDSGGEVKGSPEVYLEQSSIKAGFETIDFIEGKFEVPTCYYEFAMRYHLPDGELFSGFIADSANKIFESTNYYEKK